MFISVKPVNFSDEELDYIYTLLSSEYDDLEIFFDEHQIDPEDEDRIDKLGFVQSILDKISASGIIS